MKHAKISPTITTSNTESDQHKQEYSSQTSHDLTSAYSNEMMMKFSDSELSSFSGKLYCQKLPTMSSESSAWSLKIMDIRGKGAEDFFGKSKMRQIGGIDSFELLDPTLAEKHQKRVFTMLNHGPSHRLWDNIFGMFSRNLSVRSPRTGQMKDLQMHFHPIQEETNGADKYTFEVKWLDHELENRLQKEKEYALSRLSSISHDNRGLVTLLRETTQSLENNNDRIIGANTEELHALLDDNRELFKRLSGISDAIELQTRNSYGDIKHDIEQKPEEHLKSNLKKEAMSLKYSIFSNLEASGIDTKLLDLDFSGLDTIEESSKITIVALQAIHAALYNLCKNSFEANARKVEVYCTESINNLFLNIIDDGPGLTEDLSVNFFSRHRIKSPRSDEKEDNSLTTKRGEGTINSTRLIEGIGGKCEVVKRESGTEFLLSIPTITRNLTVDQDDIDKINHPNVTTKILLVEDSPVIMKGLLKDVAHIVAGRYEEGSDLNAYYQDLRFSGEYNQYGYALLCHKDSNTIIAVAKDGDVAQNLFSTTIFNALITDQHMPNKCGSDLIKDTRARSNKCDILLLSADPKDSIDIGEGFFSEYAVQFCNKTSDPSTKKETIKNFITESYLQKENIHTEERAPLIPNSSTKMRRPSIEEVQSKDEVNSTTRY